jgi:pimeloyl-ACP methyl ester carboxylesterase
MAARPDSAPTLEDVEEPALVVVGDEDALAPPAEAHNMVESLPRGRLVVIEGCGHISAMERPDALTEALRTFLTDAGSA